MADSTSDTTSRFGSLKSQIGADFSSTTTWVLIPVGIGLNAAGGFIANTLKLPLFLDNIGTILLAILVGPWAAALTGGLSNVISGMIGNPIQMAFIMSPIAMGLVAGFLARRGLFETARKVVIAGVLIGLTSVVFSVPVVVVVFGGVTSAGMSVVTSLFVASGLNIAVSALLSQLIVDIVDKTIMAYAAYLIAEAVPQRYLPTQGQQALS
ncbi:ECF transporter S component [halophilic archaeon]|nr:ECF transporter S component [halophilic archaeon]